MNPIGLAMTVISYGCSHGAFGNTCDKDIECMSWLKMPSCYESYNAPIQTPLYREALKRGRNIPTKIMIGERNMLADFLFEVR